MRCYNFYHPNALPVVSRKRISAGCGWFEAPSRSVLLEVLKQKKEYFKRDILTPLKNIPLNKKPIKVLINNSSDRIDFTGTSIRRETISFRGARFLKVYFYSNVSFVSRIEECIEVNNDLVDKCHHVRPLKK